MSNVKLSPRAFGGEQERKRRAGTENIAAIVGFQEAVVIANENREAKRKRFFALKKTFMEMLDDLDVKFDINGLLEYSLPHVLNLSFPGTSVESMLVNLDLSGIAVSSGSACTAGSIDPSHVLVAMFGKQSDRLTNSIRFSFGFTTTTDEVIKTAEEIAKVISRLKK
jgi:cysteine desulfurase